MSEEFVYPKLHVNRDVEENGKLYREAVTPPVCDFCFDKRVRWSYPCAEFYDERGVMEGYDDHAWGSTGEWACCDACSARIEASDVSGLIRRAALSKIKGQGRPQRVAFLEASMICRGFILHRDGEREAFG